MNNDNKVILGLEAYISMLDEIKESKRKADAISNNFDSMCNYIKEELIDKNNYHIKNLLEDKLDVNSTLNVKLKNYHYENLFNSLIKVGITFDLIEKIIDSVIIENQMVKEEEKNNG